MIVLCMLCAQFMLQVAASEEAPRRFLSIGDLHGDFSHSSELLKALGVMDVSGHWCGGRSILVQTGDVVDRGDHAKDIYEMLFRLQEEAPRYGGEVFLLLGNHELMNMQGDFRYSSGEDVSEIGGSIVGRSQAFGPSGWPGQRLRERNQVLALVEARHGLDRPVLYAHAGLLPDVAGLSAPTVDAFNLAVRKHLVNKTESEIRADDTEFFSESGPLWTRRLALDTDSEVCDDLSATLRLFGASRMIVGHTAQEDGKIHHRCDGRLILADTLISDAYTGQSHPSAVEVLPSGEAFALYPTRGAHEALPKVDALDGIVQTKLGDGFLLKAERRHVLTWDEA